MHAHTNTHTFVQFHLNKHTHSCVHLTCERFPLMTQHRYADEVERSLHPIGGGLSYGRPSARSQANQRERERDREMLQEAMSLYLTSDQPSHRHRGAAPMTPAGDPSRSDL